VSIPRRARGRRWAVVPAKSFARAKSRLTGVLDATARSALARDMLEAVLRAVDASGCVDAILVATDGDDVAELAASHGARVLTDVPARSGMLGAVVDRALAHTRELGADEALVVMADLPLITAEDVAALARGLHDADVVLAADAAARGTNALALHLHELTETELGHADSFQRHLASARRLGLRSRVVERVGLATDVDTPADLARLAPATAAPHAPRRPAGAREA